ncbi:hypothetical protein V7S43_014047 [Phytophthora oleae]|uniref:Uncharacterized protein n=1 Tax=Phytophthora oleae TaxID=2107226 RepID=A0ABD3F5R6_9STRA
MPDFSCHQGQTAGWRGGRVGRGQPRVGAVRADCAGASERGAPLLSARLGSARAVVPTLASGKLPHAVPWTKVTLTRGDELHGLHRRQSISPLRYRNIVLFMAREAALIMSTARFSRKNCARPLLTATGSLDASFVLSCDQPDDPPSAGSSWT